MGDMHFQRAVALGQGDALIGLSGAQAQDVVLQGVQQAVVAQVFVFGIQAELLAALAGGQAEQGIEEVPSLLAETRQQRMADIEIPIISAALGLARQFTNIANLAPGFAARVERADHYVDMSRQTIEHAQVVRRQAADAEHQQALGQAGQGLVAVEPLQQIVEQPRAVRMAVLGQLAPEQRLPGFVRTEIEGFATLPGGQPVVAIEQVLVEHVSDLGRQRQPPALIAAVEILRQTRRQLEIGRLAEPAVEAPGQGGRGKRRLLGQAAKHRAAQVPDELGRQLNLQLHGDALLARQLKRQPAAHALARYHHQRRGERIGERLGEQARGQFAEGFEVRGVVEAEHECTA